MLSVVVENEDYEPVTLDDVGRWRDAFDLPFPALADVDGAWVAVWGDRGSQHAYTVVDRAGVVTLRLEAYSGEAVDALVEGVEAVP